jgi:hypothetical protein
MKRLAGLLVLTSFLASFAHGVVFYTPGGATDTAGETVDAAAAFDLSTDYVTIDLFNLLTADQVISVGQNVSDIFFSVDNLTSSADDAVYSNSTFVNVGPGGVTTPGTSVPNATEPNDFVGWDLTNSGGIFHLSGIDSDDGHDDFIPAHTLLGGLAGDTYVNANASIVNNDPHNPFAQTEATFVFYVPGATADSVVSNVVFSFGTVPGDNVPSTPEPASIAAIGVGALGLLRRRLKKA